MAAREGPSPASIDARRRVSRQIAGAYFLFAVAWIAITDLALFEVTRDLSDFAGASLAKGAAFVAISTAVLYYVALQVVGRDPDQGALAAGLPERRSGTLAPALLFGLMAGIAIALVIVMFYYESGNHRDAARQQLRAILDVKAHQLELLLEQRQAMAVSQSRSRILRGNLEQIAVSAEARGAIQARVEQLQRDLDFDAALVIDATGRLIAGAGPPALAHASPALFAEAKRVLATGISVSSFLHQGGQQEGGPIVLDYLTPLRGIAMEPANVGVLVVREDARARLFPLLGRWPTPTASAETLLVSKDGDDIVYLTDALYEKNAALRMRRSLSQGDLIAVKALGMPGPLLSDGVDYRGVAVVAASRPVAGTDWFMIAKMDRDEMLAPARRSAAIWLGSILCMALLAAFGVAIVWRQQLRLVAANERAESARRALAEQKLGESEERYRALFERSLDCVFVCDFAGNFLDANRAALELLGYRREEIPSINFRDLLAPEDAARAFSALHDIVVTGNQPEMHEYRLRHKDGRELHVEVRTTLIYQEDRPSAVLGTARDVTDRLRAQRELEVRNTVLLTQQEASPDGVLLVDESNRIASYNRRFLEIWNIPEALARAGHDEPVLNSVVGQMRNAEEFINKVKYLYSNRAEKSRDELHTTDGRVIERHSAPVMGQGGKYFGRVWYFRDVTESRNAERVLRESRNLLQRILENIPVRVFWKDSELRYLGCNTAFARDAGLSSPEQLIGKNDFEMTWRDQAAIYRADDQRVMDSGDSKIGYEEPQTSPDGQKIWLSTSKVPLRDSDGRIFGLLGIYDDITDRKHAEELVRESEQRFRTIVEQSISGFYLIQDGKFGYVNARFAEIFGYSSPEEIVGRSPAELVAPGDRATVTENIRRRLAGELKEIAYSFTGLRKDGSEVEVGVHGSIAAHGGRPAIIGLLQDISERRRAEEEIKRYVARLEQAMQSTINVVATIGELRDPYTHGHERRVGEIAAAIATEMGLENMQVDGIRIAGYLHDVGKIAVPAEILSRPGKLTKAEYDLVKDHAQQSYEILKTVPFPWPVAEAAWQHHERLDGSGYPRGLKGEEILLEARVLAVADTLEAMSSHRPYRPGLGVEKALEEIERNRGRLYDPLVVDACLRLFREKGYKLPA